MTPNQEDALYEFLDDAVAPFALKDAANYVRSQDSEWAENLPADITAFLASGDLAFRVDGRRWISRRGFFEGIPFVISPTRLELLNGALIPGHRCIPFASPAKMPNDYRFFWKGKPIPRAAIEAPPEELYPYYSFFGEYAPQIVARDSPENEAAFALHPYEDPAEISVRTLDMRAIFREASFVPGDRFVARIIDWKAGHFSLEKVGVGQWRAEDLSEWAEAAEKGFSESFSKVGPGLSAEEQIAFAYWHGPERMRRLPAYSLEEFIGKITETIESAVEYGMESRFWHAGRDIPDSKALIGAAAPPDRTPVEAILFNAGAPVSEFVARAYVRDALFRKDAGMDALVARIVPRPRKLKGSELAILREYLSDTLEEISETYSIFLDRPMGELRTQVGDLHLAVLELAKEIRGWEVDESWLPRHTFVVLSQIQEHAANLLADLDCDEAPPDQDLEAMGSSLESMTETLSDIREMLKEAASDFRRSNLQLLGSGAHAKETWQMTQISVGGTEVWRRLLVPGLWTLEDLRAMILASLGWSAESAHSFLASGPKDPAQKRLDDRTKIQELRDKGIIRMEYAHGDRWIVRIIFIASHRPAVEELARCVSGEGSAPPEKIAGPIRYRKTLAAFEGGGGAEKRAAAAELGEGFSSGAFDLARCNAAIRAAFPDKK
ncbi:MAG: plasmid pRiA4b ORF-3 family protein [Treponema sp.]|nr:plasmid pRiA4b ORF-3 family protein [Treponema sp.]